MIKIPPYLKPGDTIGITCPAGFMPYENAARCIETLQQWGYKVITGDTLRSNSGNYFSGTDDERAAELQSMLDDKSINAILFGRGGYGMGRIIDQLNFKKFIRRPKWLIGYSDITVLHMHLLGNCKIAAMHAPMAGAFNEIENSMEYIDALKNALTGSKLNYSLNTDALSRRGKASGIILGGNLSLLSNVVGTSSDFNTKNRILFLEDTGEYLYKIDRMLYQLKRSGKFEALAGLIVGGFTDMKDTVRPFGKTVNEIIKDLISGYDFPVCFNFPVSHTKENLALKIGVEYTLKVNPEKTSLREI